MKFWPAFLLLWAAAPLLSAQDERVATISPEELKDYESYPAPVKSLVERSLVLTRMGLRYTYGSADPAKGGMDCSGTIHHLLLSAGIKNVPRQANTLYRWAWIESRFHAVASLNPDSFEFQNLKPGDLLFWSGTYVVDRDPPVTHVMLYLGRLKADGRRVMFGASSGRRYAGKSRDGVSVFDFQLPRADSEGRFLGYASIPGWDKIPPAAPAVRDPAQEKKPEGAPPATPPDAMPQNTAPEPAPAPRALPVEPAQAETDAPAAGVPVNPGNQTNSAP
ncbi:MAG: NlpC/P60 family protein [Candidatus Methylacidiphilales bacterium]|nr:NlpC/P60 family protein [Candidatus Methylacidiphilales bacterium]